MNDLISRQAAVDVIDAILPVEPMKNEYTQGITCGAALAIEYVKQLPSAQPEHLVKESGNLVNGLVNDCISRQAAIDALDALCDRECEYSKQQRSFMCGACRLGSAFDVIDELPSAQPEHTETHSCDCERTETHDLVSRQSAIDSVCEVCENCEYFKNEKLIQTIKDLPPAQPRWIPFKTRPLTDEEKEEYPYYDDMLDCQLPENGQRILVNVKWNGHEFVQMDEYYDDDGSYLDSGYEIGSEATAWMPLPEPYKERTDENR